MNENRIFPVIQTTAIPPIPAVTDSINGVKCPCSISMIYSLYSLLFFINFVCFWMSWLTYLLMFLLKNLKSKNVIWLVCPKLHVQICKQTSFLVRIDVWRVSSVCCFEAKHGNLCTFLLSRDISDSVMSYRNKPTFLILYNIKCCRSNFAPYSQFVGNLGRAQPHLIQIRL